jgi:IS4 transposase
MKLVKDRDPADRDRGWGFVFAMARTWKTADENMIKHLVAHLPHKLYHRTWIPKDIEGQGRKTFWIYGKRLCLCHIGDVTVVLSKKGRNMGPKKTKILVTNLLELTPRQVVSMYQKRWTIELVNWELKSALGLGQHQVSGDKQRSINSVGIAVLAYLLLLRVCHHEITPGQSWSIFQLQHVLQLRAMTNQVEHNVKVKVTKGRKAA